MTWTVRRLRAWGVPWLQSRGIDTPSLDADLLLADALGVQRLDLFLDPDRPTSQEELAAFKRHMQRRAKREPVAYILGSRAFWQHDFIVTSDVLVPRPETELLVDTVLAAFPARIHGQDHGQDNVASNVPRQEASSPSPPASPLEILEIGVGSGALLCSLLLEYPNARGTGIDISPAALAVAERNAERHGCLDRTTLLLGDLVEPLGGANGTLGQDSSERSSSSSYSNPMEARFHVIVSNPPYITTPELAGLEPEVCLWEPRQALDGGEDGFAVLRRLPRAVAPFLAQGGLLALEIGATQGEAVSGFMRTAGYQDVRSLLDFARLPRVVTGRGR